MRIAESTLIQDIPTNEPDGLKLYFVDLGLQIGYRTTFVLEYLSALLPYIIFYILLEKNPAKFNMINIRLAALCWFFHFCKRIYESIYVHKFSRASMPLNMVYYGYLIYLKCRGFSIFIGYSMHRIQSRTTPSFFVSLAFTSLFFVLFEINQFSCSHIAIMSVTFSFPNDNQTHRPCPKPSGANATILYNFVSFPNYFYEILTWISFTLLTRSLSSAAFTGVGAATMISWASAKHAIYRKNPTYPKNRKAIIPYIL
ncbi:hypothetical protein MXB_2651 [Myxobolus squamalis]|nr:hypothetical protein MXB_2651 [Myxobolus squamalis]